MIDFSNIKVGEKVYIGDGAWNDDLRAIHAAADEFAKAQTPRWQFQTERYFWNRKKSGEGDKYHIERIK